MLEYDTYSGIPGWYFQNSFPTLFSKYQVSIPSNYRFSFVTRTNLPFEKVKKESELDSKQSAVYNAFHGGSRADVTTWVRRDLPALKEEAFRKGENNYLERVKIYFTSNKSSWDDISKAQMRETNTFSRVYEPNLFANKKVKELTQDKKDDLEKAKAIYSFVRDNFILSDYQKKEDLLNLKNTFDNKKGKQIEINLVLVTMMLKAGLNAETILLSAKPDESLNSIFPDFKDVDYVLTKVSINNKDYFLDPTEKYLPFGHLLERCYNGYSRIMSKK